jgi:hypothetical protein
MNSLEFEALKLRIIARLENRGAAKSQTLASELDAPQGNVQLALEQLRDAKERLVRRLPFGLWDVNSEEKKAA